MIEYLLSTRHSARPLTILVKPVFTVTCERVVRSPFTGEKAAVGRCQVFGQVLQPVSRKAGL